MVVEGMPKIKDAKIKFPGQLDKCCTEDTIIATITSYTEVATSLAMSTSTLEHACSIPTTPAS